MYWRPMLVCMGCGVDCSSGAPHGRSTDSGTSAQRTEEYPGHSVGRRGAGHPPRARGIDLVQKPADKCLFDSVRWVPPSFRIGNGLRCDAVPHVLTSLSALNPPPTHTHTHTHM